MTELDQELQRKTTRATLASRALVVVGLVLLSLILGMQLFATVQTGHVTDGVAAQQDRIRGTQKNNTELLKLVKSCTTPGQPCYERGQQQTAGAVATINRVVVLAAACSVGISPALTVVERQARIQGCVIDRLARVH